MLAAPGVAPATRCMNCMQQQGARASATDAHRLSASIAAPAYLVLCVSCQQYCMCGCWRHSVLRVLLLSRPCCLPQGPRPPCPACATPHVQSYSRDVFVFIFVVLTAVAGGYSLKQHRTLLLHRTQTEEWKGWMQVGAGCRCRPFCPAAARVLCSCGLQCEVSWCPPRAGWLGNSWAARPMRMHGGHVRCWPAAYPAFPLPQPAGRRSCSCSTTTSTPRRFTTPSASSSLPTCG